MQREMWTSLDQRVVRIVTDASHASQKVPSIICQDIPHSFRRPHTMNVPELFFPRCQFAALDSMDSIHVVFAACSHSFFLSSDLADITQNYECDLKRYRYSFSLKPRRKCSLATTESEVATSSLMFPLLQRCVSTALKKKSVPLRSLCSFTLDGSYLAHHDRDSCAFTLCRAHVFHLKVHLRFLESLSSCLFCKRAIISCEQRYAVPEFQHALNKNTAPPFFLQ